VHPPPLVYTFVNDVDDGSRRFPRILKRAVHAVVRVEPAECETEPEEDRNEIAACDACYTGTTLSLVTG
jgi:hypothetical protein